MNTLENLQSADPTLRRQAIAQLARSGSPQVIPALRSVQQNDPVANLRDLAVHAIEDIDKRTVTAKQRKNPPMPSPFVEEVIQLTPATPRPTPHPTPVKRPFAASLQARQYSADPEQFEGSTRRNLLPFIVLVVLITVVLFAALIVLR